MAHDINIFERIENIKLGFFPNIGSSNNADIIIGIFNILILLNKWLLFVGWIKLVTLFIGKNSYI